jgi:hypothetical protein
MKSKSLLGEVYHQKKFWIEKHIKGVFPRQIRSFGSRLAAVELEASRKSHASPLYIPNHAHNPEKLILEGFFKPSDFH